MLWRMLLSEYRMLVSDTREKLDLDVPIIAGKFLLFFVYTAGKIIGDTLNAISSTEIS